MQASTLRREFFTSLVGTVPMADLLADLPMPSHMPTPMEQSVNGEIPLSAESRKLLNITEPSLCNKITKALLSVDTSFLEPKSHVSSEPYVPNQHALPLIQSVFNKSICSQPTLRINKLDPSKYQSPVKSTGEPGTPLKTIADINLPGTLSGSSTPTTKQEDTWRDITDTTYYTKPTKLTSHRLARTGSDDGRLRKKSSTTQKKTATSECMLVSIDRRQLTKKTKEPSVSKKRGSGVRGKKKKQYHHGGDMKEGEKPMVVRLERRKITGPLGMKPAPLTHSDSFTMMMNTPDPLTTIEPRRTIKKKKKRHSHHGDPTRIAAVQHYSFLVDSLLDTEDQISDDNLLSRSAVSQLVAETIKLKQLSVLHEISVEGLVRLIAILDIHVLDSAEVHMNTIPDDGEGDIRAWREITRERVLRSIDAALVILHINTAPHMPKNVHQEESLEQLIAVIKFHLDNNIYPEFDPVYRAGTKEGSALPRQKRRHGGSHIASKDVQAVYRRLTEVVENLALLLETQPLTDTTVLQISSLGTFPFFVENVSALQLSSLRLVRAVFSRYDKHRELILEDIFASLARLPTTKRNLRSFKLSNGSSVQMVTALILQLVQCIVTPPNNDDDLSLLRPDTPSDTTSDDTSNKIDPDVQMINSYELALTTGKTFLSTFMKKCCGGKDEEDFRPLFDNFVQDLLTTLNLPEWPASEVLLTLLGVLLVHSFSNRNNDHGLRVISLDHLGVIAARLRRDATDSVDNEHEELISILAQVMQGRVERKTPSPTMTIHMDAFSENSKHLQKVLIAYLNKRSGSDPSCAYSRDFYLGQWLRDTQLELEKAMKDTSEDIDPDINGDAPVISSSAMALQQAEMKKDILHSLIGPKNQTDMKYLESVLDNKCAALVTRYLASSRALSRSFDVYLQQLIRVLSEPEVRMRTRAMKALSSIIDADPSILSRPDMQRAVQYRFMDQSTLVREAAVDLLGRSVLSRPELTAQYYDMLSERILDTGVSVRKRVIKILKDVCIMQPQFPRTSEICVKIMRRISDEEGIKQLVSSVFRELWFTMPPTGAALQRQALERRVNQITAVVASCKEYEWFEQLLQQLLKTEDKSSVKVVLDVSQMMVDCLVESLLTLDETSATAQTSTAQGASSLRLVTCVTTLYLFCKTHPSLLLRHATTLHPYLSSKCSSQGDMMVLHYVAQILRQVVPLLEHPSEQFLASLEEDLIKLVMKHGQMLVQSCIHCLGAIVNNVTQNYPLVRDCFHKFFLLLEKVKTLHTQNRQNIQLKSLRPSLLRSTFTVGLLCKHFDVDSFMPTSTQDNPVSGRVYSQLVYFSRHEDEEVQLKAVTGLGFYCVRHPEMMLEQSMRDLYSDWLASHASSKKKCQVLRNLQYHLKEVETTLKVADVQGSDKQADKENLLEFGDQQSNVSSNIAQAFLTAVLEAFLDTELQVRLGAVQVLLLIIRQGLVHPEQCIPYLITISTDPESTVRIKANQQLTEHSSRYGHFVQTTLMAGVKKSSMFHNLLYGDKARGYLDTGSSQTALLAHLYSLLRSNKQYRRAFLRALLRYFEDYERNSLSMLLYLADNLAYCPYSTLEEPLFVIHHVDMTISVSGSNILQAFSEALGMSGAVPSGEDDNDDISQLSQRGCDMSHLVECCRSSHACFLLLLLKQHLKRMYGLTDSKCQQYSPTESNKAFDKTINRRSGIMFEPRSVLEELQRSPQAPPRTKEDYLKQYIEFKQLMNRLDPFEEGDDSDGGEAPRDHSTTPAPPPPPPSSSLPQSASTTIAKVELEGNVGRGENQSSSGVPTTNLPRGRSRSRASSSSSTNSKRSKKTKTNTNTTVGSRKRRRFFSSDSDEDDPDFTT